MRHSPTIDRRSDGTWQVNCQECSQAAQDYIRCAQIEAAYPALLHEQLRPVWSPEATSDISSAVFQALGAASVCWVDTPLGEFDSTRCKAVGDGLVAWLMDNM